MTTVPVPPAGVVGVVGLGLIGGSLARAVVERGGHAVATTRSSEVRRSAAAAGITVVDDISAVVEGADLVVLAVPLPALDGALSAVADALKDASEETGPTVTDVGSVKAPIAAFGAERLGARFVPGHPMAGTEHAGWEATDPDLFEGRRWALVAEEPVALDRWATAAGIAVAVGADVVPVTSTEHDSAVGLVSHLPYALAAAVAAMLDSDPRAGLARALAAGSFADLTRVAAGHPTLGAEMAAANHHALAERLDQLATALEGLAHGLSQSDGPAHLDIEAVFAAGRAGRLRLDAARSASVQAAARTLDRDELLELGHRGGWVSSADATRPGSELVSVRACDPGGVAVPGS